MAHAQNKRLTFLQKPPEKLKDSNEELYEYLNTLVTRIERILTALNKFDSANVLELNKRS